MQRIMTAMLTSLTLDRIRCFEHVELRFSGATSAAGGWTVLVGPNGSGKTTLLQAIVLGSTDPLALSALLDAPWALARSGASSPGRIRLQYSVDRATVTTEREIPVAEGSYIPQNLDEPRVRPVVMAFAARRRISRLGEKAVASNIAVERVRGMFDGDQSLLRDDAFRVFSTDDERRRFAIVIRDVLLARLDEAVSLFPLLNAVELRGQSGVLKMLQLLEQRRFTLRYGQAFDVRVALEDMSDGYQAMFALVVEILTQAALSTKQVPDPERLDAVVLIDEIEAHLHPTWQRNVVPLLRATFPHCQFVVSTHSPLVVASAEPGEVHVLEITDDGFVVEEVLEERLGMLGADRIFAEVFGVFRSAPPALVNQERAYLEQIATNGRPDPRTAALIEEAWNDARGEPEKS
jgi:hypothetical protein